MDKSEVPDCDQITKSIKYMTGKGIKSKIAMVYILMTCKSESKIGLDKNMSYLEYYATSYYTGYKRSLKTICKRWLDEKNKMKKIHDDAQNNPELKSEKEKNTYFALNVLYDLQFEKTIVDPFNRILEAMGFNPVPGNLIYAHSLF